MTTETAQYKERLEARHKTFEGFGQRKTCAEWSRTLGINKTTVWRYLQRGLTVEEIAKIRGIKVE